MADDAVDGPMAGIGGRGGHRPLRLILAAMWLACLPSAAAHGGFTERVEHGGLVIEAAIAPVAPPDPSPGPLQSGEPVTVRFRVTDPTGKPITGAYPNGWMVLRGGDPLGDADGRCRLTLRRLQTASLRNQAEVDLNTYLMLTLNDDATVSVIDPLSGFGGTRLLALVGLSGLGEDWVLLPEQDRLAVTVPEANAVDIVDTRSWHAPVRRLAVGADPRRATLQPDGAFFWVDAVDPATGAPIAVAADAGSLEVTRRIPIGQGPHDFAFTADSRFLFVANAGSGTVSIIDIAATAPAPAKEFASGPRPVSLAYSELADAVYVGDGEDGSVTVLDARSHALRTRLPGPPGITQIRFAGGGRYAFVLNQRSSTVAIIDSSRDRRIHSIPVPNPPDQVTFTGTTAFIRQSASAAVLMLPLDKIAATDGELPLLEFAGGTRPPVATDRPSTAPGIVPVAGDRAVLVANAGDREIYFYQEGLAAPMGSFSNYKREPRAVTVVRRDLRERDPGVYQTNAELGRPGSYDLVFRLNQPPLYHCFSVDVAPASALQAGQPPRVAPVAPPVPVPAGHPATLEFVVTDTTGGLVSDIADLTVLLMTPSWQMRQVATPVGHGRYSVDFAVPVPGSYAVMVRSDAAGIAYRPMPALIVTPVR